MSEPNYKNLIKQLKQLNGISPIWEKIVDMFHASLTDEEACLLLIYFSLLDDGNTCICLDSESEKFVEIKWMQKWDGLKLTANAGDEPEIAELDFNQIISKGIEAVLSNERIFQKIDESGENIQKPFVLSDSWLFAAKYYEAKISIEKNIKEIFRTAEGKNQLSESDINAKVKSLLKDKNSKFALKTEQIKAIQEGLNKNLIVTGGPGTGKTTVVCYLLWFLLEQAEYKDFSIKLAAPSGKAADRMKESIRDSLKDLDRDANSVIYDKLQNVESYTIHRLLSYSPAGNEFNYNKDNKFDSKTIFVIDEASMIDIDLFKSLLEAIPAAAKVFILGDKNQLPSVQAGAVLGEILGKKQESVVTLNESVRFSEKSQAGVLSEEFNADGVFKTMLSFSPWNQDSKFTKYEKKENHYPVTFYDIHDESKTEKTRIIKEMAEYWCDLFYGENTSNEKLSLLRAKCEQAQKDSDEKVFDEIWKIANQAKILCAERKGIRGTDSLNEMICKKLLGQKKSSYFDKNRFFPGELLMLSSNQKQFNLYNGDSGVVVRFVDDSSNYLMLEKSASADENTESGEKDGIFRIGKYIFYRLDFLPADSIEIAFAITIHKSQGSGYENILIFVPEDERHPLLNRQIVYTAITRTKGATYIVASEQMMQAAKNNKIERDTQIIF